MQRSVCFVRYDMNKDRPSISFEDMVDKLVFDYGLEINNRESAINALKSMSYYDLINGYQDVFKSGDKYRKGVSIEYLYTFRHFDKSLQTILFKYSTYVETKFKNILANTIAAEFGDDCTQYLDINNYVNPYAAKRKNKLQLTINRIEKEKLDAINNCSDPTYHYAEKHNHIPPWILLKNITFNSTIDLYSFLPHQPKKIICDELVQYGIQNKDDFLKNALTITRKFRNVIAHNSKFITFQSPRESIKTTDLFTGFGGTLLERNDNKKGLGQKDAYSMILSMVVLLSDEYLSLQLLSELLTTITNFSRTDDRILADYCMATKLPLDIKERIEKHIRRIST